MKYIIAVCVLLAVVVGLVVFDPWGAAYAIGIHPYPAGTPWTYQLWSGFIPGMAIVSIFGGVSAHFKHINCHVHRCWRIGNFELAGGQFKVCKKHSPHPEKLTHQHILAAHRKHTERCETGQ